MSVGRHPRFVSTTVVYGSCACFVFINSLLFACRSLRCVLLLLLQVTPELVQSMREYFASFNAELQELLGRPLPENWSLPSGPSSGSRV